MSQQPVRRVTLASLAALSVALLPALFFYAVVFRMIVNLPFEDDYDILHFMLHQRATPSPVARVIYAFTAQHNEYKLILENVLFTIQWSLFQRVSFPVLDVIGDISILLLAIVLWEMFLPNLSDMGYRISLFIPASWLLFQLSYAETLNWAAPTIQNLYILTFSFSCFLLLTRNNARAFFASLIFLILAIAASANGFITVIVGVLMLLDARRIRDLIAWFAVSIGMLLLYAYHYNSMASQSNKGHNIAATILHIDLLYLLSFLGSLGSFVRSISPVPAFAGSLVLGSILILFFAWESRRGHLSGNPAVVAAVIFILLTGVGVACFRSDLGAKQSLAYRYRVYCSLLLVLAWFVVAEKYLQHSRRPLLRNAGYLAGCTSAILFSLLLDASGYRYFQARRSMLIEGMSLYEHRDQNHSTNGPLFIDNSHFVKRTTQENEKDRRLLQQSSDAGIYQPPQYE